MLAKLGLWWAGMTSVELGWLCVGFAAQLMFSMRFVVQWLSSERAGRSVMPDSFWYLSLAGGMMLLAYAVYRVDPVFVLGQGCGLIIYARNIQLIRAAARALKGDRTAGQKL